MASSGNRKWLWLYDHQQWAVGRQVRNTLKRLILSWLERKGCKGCMYEHRTIWELPCSDCRRRYRDRWSKDYRYKR